MDNWGDKLIKFLISQAPIFLTLQSKKKRLSSSLFIAHHYTSLVVYERKHN